jgi:hypothetical protein
MLKTVTNVRYLNKNNNANERLNYSKWWKEQIEHYGTSVTYFTHGYSLTSHNFLYGEDPTSKYGKIENVVMLTDITNDALMLSKFGIMADCDMTAVIHISSFYEKAGCGKEPKAGDLIQLTEYGADRPGGRSAPIYEITERDDEYLQNTNSLIGHYVWYIKCKRFEYSYEPGLQSAPNNKQISDAGDYGRLAGGENPQDIFQPYPDSIQNSAKSVYDYYSGNEESLSLTPGYYLPPTEPVCPQDLTAVTLSSVPGPYSAEEVMTAEDIQMLKSLSQSTGGLDLNSVMQAYEFINANKENLMTRKLLSSSSNGYDTFIMETSSKSADDIYYTTNLSSSDLFMAVNQFYQV